MLTLNYPHIHQTLEPARMRKEEIWRLGELARAQVGGSAARAKLELLHIISRCKEVAVNGVRFSTHWELNRPVTDGVGNPVLGAVEYDENWPSAAMIYINGELIADRDDVARATSVHELAHALFDVPGWIRAAEAKKEGGSRRILLVQDETKAGIDWPEWRANEFMGAFLAPRALLHRHTLNRAAALRIPLHTGDRPSDLPVVNGKRASFEQKETLAIELAELFGLSLPFILVRLHKYGLVAGTRENAA